MIGVKGECALDASPRRAKVERCCLECSASDHHFGGDPRQLLDLRVGRPGGRLQAAEDAQGQDHRLLPLPPARRPELGSQILDKITEATAEIANVDTRSRLEGRQMTMILSPLAQPH